MKITPIFRARINSSSTAAYTSTPSRLPPKKISLSLEGRSGALYHVVCHLGTAYNRIYYKKDMLVYIQYREYRNDAKYGQTSVFFDFVRTAEYGVQFLNPLGLLTHPTLSLELLQEEFEKLNLVHMYRPSNAAFDFGLPTSMGVICDTEENTTLTLLSQ